VYRPNALKKKLLAGKKVVGCWSMIGSPVVSEILGLVGFDFLLNRPGAHTPAVWEKAYGVAPPKGFGHGAEPVSSVYAHLFPELMRPDLAEAPGNGRRFLGFETASYGGLAPRFRRLVFRSIPEEIARISAVRTGAVHLVGSISPNQADSLQRAGQVQVPKTDSNRTMVVQFNKATAPADNPLFRPAVGLAINRE
jgi:hypothetical protein